LITTEDPFEPGKVAVSVGELGTVAGVQLEALFQLLVGGSTFQVALPALSVGSVVNSTAPPQSRTDRNDRNGFIDLVLSWGV
jgi:hypothetical protein